MAPVGRRSKWLRYQLEPDFRRELSTAEGCAALLLVVYREREKAAHLERVHGELRQALEAVAKADDEVEATFAERKSLRKEVESTTGVLVMLATASWYATIAEQSAVMARTPFASSVDVSKAVKPASGSPSASILFAMFGLSTNQ